MKWSLWKVGYIFMMCKKQIKLVVFYTNAYTVYHHINNLSVGFLPAVKLVPT